MTNRTQERRKSRAGFSLVEVTLALLVVAIGLTATFALFPEGLRMTRASVDDTECAMFAEYVFTTLDLTAGKYPGGFGGAGWTIADTDDFTSLMLSRNEPPAKKQIRDGGSAEAFYWYPDHYGLDSGDLKSDKFADYWTSAFTYTLTLGVSTWKGYGSGASTYAVLKVWPGEYETGVTPKGDPRIFYREIVPLR